MAIEFFDKEVRKVQQKFNVIFGRQTIVDLKARHSTVLSICFLGMLGNNITTGQQKDRDDVREFMRIRKVLNNFLIFAEGQQEKRRDHVRRNIDERSNAGRCGDL